MSVHVLNVFKAVSGYELNDKIELKYTDIETDEEKTLSFTIKGYTEDIFFSSTDTVCMGFYLTEDTYQIVEGILNNPLYRAHVVFTNLDDLNKESAFDKFYCSNHYRCCNWKPFRSSLY